MDQPHRDYTVRESWYMEPGKVLGALDVLPEQGLSEQEAATRLHHHGRNLLATTRPRHVLIILADQLKSSVVVLLALAALLAMVFGDHIEGFSVLVVIAINTAIGFVTEWRATRSMESLRRLARIETVVRRDGNSRIIHSDELVPGDIVLIEPGDIITADLRLVETFKLQADESTLTGESLPVDKQCRALGPDTELVARSNLLFKGTTVTRGTGVGVVVATGLSTELGKISTLVSAAAAQETPLEKRLSALSQRLVWLVLGITALVALAGILAGREIILAIEVAIALAVAAIPEGLPIVATIALARGMWRMARCNALIARLSAVETLGATGVILSDKTGTLTENRMTVSTIELSDGTVKVEGTGLATVGAFTAMDASHGGDLLELTDEVLRAAVLCSNASLELNPSGFARVVGDPTESALLVAAAKRGMQAAALRQAMPELREEPFDPEIKAMATFNQAESGVQVSVKGAPECVLPMCAAVRTVAGRLPLGKEQVQALLVRAHVLAGQGLRTLAVATRMAAEVHSNPYERLVFLGIVGLRDPPRPGVKAALMRIRDAGVRVVMITGDHVATATNIALELGLVDAQRTPGAVVDAHRLFAPGHVISSSELDAVTVIARATPQQKLDLIDQFQRQGSVVAMTGDGVNDAPALKKADIGIAMGLHGTDVAREAAAMVLQDDEFATIAEAIAQGRAIYENIRKFVVYLFSCNISEILIVSLATLAEAPLPLLPLQILLLNLVTDVFPALALGVGQGSPDLMSRPPRPANQPLMTRYHWWLVISYGGLLSAAVLGAMALAFTVLQFNAAQATTISFCTLALAQLWHVFNMRTRPTDWLRSEISSNGWIWAALSLCLAVVLGAVYLPGINNVLGLTPPGPTGWLIITGMSLLPVALGPVVRMAVAGIFHHTASGQHNTRQAG